MCSASAIIYGVDTDHSGRSGKSTNTSAGFIGGLELASGYRASWPLVGLNATTDALIFRLRFGLSHIGPKNVVGPWVAGRAEVARIRPVAGVLKQLVIELRMVDGRVWTFGSYKPHEVLARLRQLGYPVRLPMKDL